MTEEKPEARVIKPLAQSHTAATGQGLDSHSTRSEWLQLHALDLAALSWEEVRPGEAREKQGQKNPWTFLSVLSSDRGERGEPERSQSHAHLDAGALPPGACGPVQVWRSLSPRERPYVSFHLDE